MLSVVKVKDLTAPQLIFRFMFYKKADKKCFKRSKVYPLNLENICQLGQAKISIPCILYMCIGKLRYKLFVYRWEKVENL